MRTALQICTYALFAIGLLMIFSTTSAETLDLNLSYNHNHAVVKQLLYGAMGLLAAMSAYWLGYRRLMTLSPWLMIVAVVLLAMVLVPSIGREVNGSRRWLNVAGFSFQPSEFVKYLLPAYFIQRALAEEKGGWTLWRFFKLMALPIFAIVLIMVEPNNGTAAVVGMLLIVLCVLIRLPFKFWGIPLLMLALAGSVFAYNHPYIAARIQVYLHPELDLKGRGHQPHQARIAVGSGGLWGRGPGNSLQKLSYLPEAQNDYIAAIYAEEFGFMGMVLLVALYSAIAAISYAIAIAARDRHGFYLAAAILFLISFQAFLNLAVVSGLLPSTGLNLPFFSQGGSSLVANMVAIALLLSIAAPCNQKVYNQHSAQL